MRASVTANSIRKCSSVPADMIPTAKYTAEPVTADKPWAGKDELQHHSHGGHRGWPLLALSFSTLGVIYGDIGTSPLYAYQAVFTAPPTEQQVLSAASLFFWTLTLIVLVKYVGIVLRFDDNGEGGTFALYSLICRAAGFGPFGPADPTDMHFQGTPAAVVGLLPSSLAKGRPWSLQVPSVGGRLREWYHHSRAAQISLLVIVMFATAMVIGDGVLTPSISVLSAISGLQVATALPQSAVVGITIAVLVVLFSVQHLGTGKISAAFAPIVTAWFLYNAALGFYNLSRCGWGVWQALSPHHAIYAFTLNGFEPGWQLLAGVMLCITGAEAMYADLGHFNARAVVLSFCGCVYPCLIVTYMGQASYVLAHPESYTNPFWISVPAGGAFWVMLVIATAASVVASQALISGVFSILRQAMALGVLPRLKITHTDEVAEGQIYIGQVNYMLLAGCIAMVAGFQDTTAMGHAYGVAVITVMFITTVLCGVVMLVCYDINPMLVLLFLCLFVPLEGLFLSSNAIKIPEGGWVTLMVAALFGSLKLIWWYGSLQKKQWLVTEAKHNSGLLHHLPIDDQDSEETTDRSAQLLPATAGSAAAHRTGSSNLAVQSTPLGANIVGFKGLQESCAISEGIALSAAAIGDSKVLKSHSMPPQRSSTGGSHRALAKELLMSFNNSPLARIPGVAIIYTAGTSGVPAVWRHLLVNIPALHQVTVLLNLRFTPVPYVTDQQRFLVRKSQKIPGVYRVVVRYGYMEPVSQGPEFTMRLIGCLVKHVAASGAHQHKQQQQQQRQQPDYIPNPRHAAASSAVISGQPNSSRSHTVIGPRLLPITGVAVASTAGTGEDDGASTAMALGRWSRVSMSVKDEGALLEASSAGAMPAESVAANLLSAPPGPAEELQTFPSITGQPQQQQQHIGHHIRRQLGRESWNRWQYHEQKKLRQLASFSLTRHSNIDGSSSPKLAAAAAASPRVSTFTQSVGTSSGNSDGVGAHTTSSHISVQMYGMHKDTVTDVDQVIQSQTVHKDTGDFAMRNDIGAAVKARPPLSKQQLAELDLLLSCCRQRAVHIVGGTRIVGATPGSNILRRVVIAAYKIMDVNKQPATSAWQLSEDQLLEVTLAVRL